MTVPAKANNARTVIAATVTPLASILGSGLLIIVPVLERTLGALSVFAVAAICGVAWLIGGVIRHNVVTVEPLKLAGTLDVTTKRIGRTADAVIVIAYVISVALYLRIMAQYVVGFFSASGSAILEPIIACIAMALIVGIGALRGFTGLNKLDRVSLVVVILLTLVLGVVLLVHDGSAFAGGHLRLPPVPHKHPLDALLIVGGLVITVQGFETVRYLGDRYSAATRVPASRLAQWISSVIYIGFVVVATPVMGLGSSAGADNTLLDITSRIAPWLAIPLVLSAVLSQFSAAIADTAAADGNLRGLNRWFRGPRPYLLSGIVVIALAATVPTLTIVAIASRAFAVYYAIEAVIALRTSRGALRKSWYGLLALLMLAIALFALPAG